MARSEDTEGKYKRGANRTKEQREFPEYIVKDLYNLFMEKYMNYFRAFAENYTKDERINAETWTELLNFAKETTKIFDENDEGGFYISEKLEGLKYIKEPSRIYMVREKERLPLIKIILEQYDIESLEDAKTAIQQWHKDNMLAACVYRIYQHIYLYLTETKK